MGLQSTKPNKWTEIVFKCEHSHLLPCNSFLIGESKGLNFVKCEHTFTLECDFTGMG